MLLERSVKSCSCCAAGQRCPQQLIRFFAKPTWTTCGCWACPQMSWFWQQLRNVNIHFLAVAALKQGSFAKPLASRRANHQIGDFRWRPAVGSGGAYEFMIVTSEGLLRTGSLEEPGMDIMAHDVVAADWSPDGSKVGLSQKGLVTVRKAASAPQFQFGLSNIAASSAPPHVHDTSSHRTVSIRMSESRDILIDTVRWLTEHALLVSCSWGGAEEAAVVLVTWEDWGPEKGVPVLNLQATQMINIDIQVRCRCSGKRTQRQAGATDLILSVGVHD